MTVDFDSFQKVLNRPGGFRDPGEPEEYCRGFQVFDLSLIHISEPTRPY